MKTLVNIKTDQEVKIKAKELAEELGLTLSAVVNAFLKQFIRDKRICFSAMPKMSKKLEQTVAKAEKDFKKGRNISPALNSPREVRDYLASL